MQDSELASPYWFPTMCYHCDNPPCTKVCPVDATFKRTDGVVAVDPERCIGCKFCMAACPYSARTFNFGRPEQTKFTEENKDSIPENYCKTGYGPEGTVSKCDFCTDRSAQGLLPACVVECPNGAIFHGDELEDAVTNGEDTYRLKELLRSRAGYRQFEELGTKPRVYYLPPVKRQFPFEDATEKFNTEE
ncbi:MAG: 4Fe-4S dicluster domain-containing protein [Bacteroidetes bacterium]|nr:4Fe-4S dicluster domain-containing protein [Bacteroidota bacterium]